MLIAEIDVVRAVDWLLRDLPAAALRGIARRAEATRLQRQRPVTARALTGRDGLARYRRPLQRTAVELTEILTVLEPPTPQHDWEREARTYAEIGSACLDLAYHIEHRLLSAGDDTGSWAVRLVHSAHHLDTFLRPGTVADQVQRSYCALFDAAVLDGRGRLRPGILETGALP
ncbi:hypothetical protein [Nocardia sp. NPDC050406]|uniref:hypothetical protein n=1 Tax=Nocardia sp. NPDC050406 TaxID=3364318 RepID=UPI0037AD1586